MKNTFLYILFVFAISSSAFAGGPWTQKKGKGYYKLSEWWLTYNQHFTDSGEIDPNITTGIFTTALYAEYGITDRLTGLVYAPLFTRNYYNNQISATTKEIIQRGEALNAVGDFDVSLKYGLTAPGAKIPVSATLTLGLPFGQIGKGDLGILQTGDGEFNQMIQIDAGTGFQLFNKSAYASTYVGFNHRTEGYSEEFRYGLEFGINLFNQKMWLIGRLTGVESFQNGDVQSINNTGIFANNAEFTSFGLEAAYYLTKNAGFSVSFAGAFRGQIIAAAPSYSVGVFYDLSK